MKYSKIGNLNVSRICIGGNPFSGFSHQTCKLDYEMKTFFSDNEIMKTLDSAFEQGVNTVFARVDNHILGIMKKYLKHNPEMIWFGQVCADIFENSNENDSWKLWIQEAASCGAKGLYMHGGLVDYWEGNKQFDRFYGSLEFMRKYCSVCGFAGHRPEAHEWIRNNIETDFQMCSYYNPTDRIKNPRHQRDGERWEYEDRNAMISVIKKVQKPVIHYKVFAAGNKPIEEAFITMGNSMKKNDVACIGVFPKKDPNMLKKDINLFNKYVL